MEKINNGFSLPEMASDQDILPVPDSYAGQTESFISFTNASEAASNAKYFDATILEKFSIRSDVNTDEMSAEEIMNYFEIKDGETDSIFKKKWADVSIYRKNGELREDLVEIFNRRNATICKERYGVTLVDKDPKTGLFLNPMMKDNPQMELIYGRGILGKYGVNDAVDLRVETVDPEGVRRVLTIRRPQDPGKPVAVPGGVVDYRGFDKQEPLKEAASREGFEEVGLELPKDAVIEEVGSYLVADPRNTALSFMGTTIFKTQVSWVEAQEIVKKWNKFKIENLKKKPEDVEAEGVEFRPLSGEENILDTTLPKFASHKKIMKA